MTKKQKRKILYTAAELIETGLYTYSCLTISRIQNILYVKDRLCQDYANFYGFDYRNFWPINGTEEETKSLRVLLLLMFAEAGL